MFPIFPYLDKFLDFVGKPLCSVEILENTDQKVLNIRTLFTQLLTGKTRPSYSKKYISAARQNEDERNSN